jgi:hypothetical protein
LLEARRPRLYASSDAEYAVRQGASWKKDVWRTASARPRPATPRRCATPSAPRWRTLISRGTARATAAPPAAATSSSSNASIAPASSGTWRASSSATCGLTITCRYTMLGRRGMSHRPGSCATCSTRRSTRFGLARRRSRSAAMRRPGSRSSATCLASTSKARSTVDRTTGRSGAGTVSAPAPTSSARSNLPKPGSRSAPGHPRRRRTGLCSADLAPRVHPSNADLAPKDSAGQRPAARHVDRAQTARSAGRDQVARPRNHAAVHRAETVGPAPAILASDLFRPTLRGGGA